MYLKRIEMLGFKSFANKIVLDFETGITAIVGPNGSGKSNVADAVRWVLGEQSAKQLRGDHMQDVIFSGTQDRKALSYAYVAITLDNADHALAVDYEELTVTRRLYRSGESEYLLNAAPCRLRDIQELFYDTGIGKEGYSIIGQGQIERIISGRPEERRELFDEAAGIVKYKKRKALTQRKLMDEESNLVRVTDILSEIEGQLAPLREEAEKAKTYLQKKETLKKYDINLFLVEQDRLQGLLSEYNEKAEITREELDGVRDAYEKTKSEYHTIEEKLEELDLAISRAREKKNQTDILKQQLEGKINVLKEQIQTAAVLDKTAEERRGAIDGELKEKEAALTAVRQEEEALQSRKQTLLDEKAEKESEERLIAARVEALETALSGAQAQALSDVRAKAEKAAQKEQAQALFKEKKKRREDLEKSLSNGNADTAAHQEAIAAYTAQLTALSEEETTEKEKTAQAEAALEALQKALPALSEKATRAAGDYQREASRLESLKAFTERYEGYGVAVRRLMEQKKARDGIIGVVADVIKTRKTYETAIETALGAAVQHVLVKDESVAKEMIAFLKENRLGRATFLPLNAMQPGKEEDRAPLSETGVLGFASELVTYDAAYRAVVSRLLGHIVVCDGIQTALAVAKKYRYRLRIVTLSGEALYPGGSIAGGAFRNTNNYLSRARELKALEEKIGRLQETAGKLQKEEAEKKEERSALYAKLSALQEKLHAISLKKNTISLSLKAEQEKEDAAREDAQKRMEAAEALRGEEKTLSEKISALEEETAALAEKEAARQAQAEKDGAALALAREEMAAFLKETEEGRLSLETVSQQLSFALANRERMEGEITRLTEEKASLFASKDTALSQIEGYRKEIRDLEQTIADSAGVYEALEKEIAEAQQEKETLNQQHRGFIEQREALSVRMANLDKEAFRLQSRKEAAEESLQTQIDYMWEEYEITPALALSLKDPSLTVLSKIKKEMAALRAQIRELGNVNVGAIESYKETNERFTFLNNQRNDLIDAKKNLENIIHELDTGMRAQFSEKFASIQRSFHHVFQTLFGGGRGSLLLAEDEDMLEAGVLISAQPPGKKLQSIMQLSGGEKTLTAIALLFAIQEMKPSPFCLLDEIEAALDDANVNRFAAYLALLTKHTQFIMITHRRGTMMAADRLYGITMQEKGVSALVSVDFANLPAEDKEDVAPGA